MLPLTSIALQFIISIGLLNVWIFRFNKKTPYRGGVATTMKEEFLQYGLPLWACYVVGFWKILSAVLLVLGIWIPALILPSAILILFLMLAAVTMHIMIRDPLKKAMPAFLVLVMSGAVIVINNL